MSTLTAPINATSGGALDLLRASFIDAMAATPTAVTLVAHRNSEGLRAQTVSAIASVSADPPSLLVCIHERSPLRERLARAGELFSVNVLRTGQEGIADTFAGRSTDGFAPYDESRVAWQTSTLGAPVVPDAAVVFECEVQRFDTLGTHTVFLALVNEVLPPRAAKPGLAYCQRDYRRIGDEQEGDAQ